jgi:hypothetical protein
MSLKEFLELVRIDEIVSIYDPAENVYIQLEILKEDIKDEYLHYKVIGIETNFDDGYNPTLEINVSR